MSRDDVYPVKTSKVGCLLHYAITYDYDVYPVKTSKFGCLLHYVIDYGYEIV